jgi:hypothetical protein
MMERISRGLNCICQITASVSMTEKLSDSERVSNHDEARVKTCVLSRDPVGQVADAIPL